MDSYRKSWLYIFNIALDRENYALSANSDLVRAFGGQFPHVQVVTRFWDKEELGSNISVTVIAGGSFFSRLRGILTLLGVSKEIISRKRDAVVLFHMNDKFAAVVTPLLYINQIKSTLWYSHAKASLSLRWSNYFVSRVLTTAGDAYPLEHRNVYALGQLVSTRDFTFSSTKESFVRDGKTILSVGRIAKVKHLEDLINELLPEHEIKAIRLIGPLDIEKELQYSRKIQQLAKKKAIELILEGPLPRTELKAIYTLYSILFSGTRKAIDKSAVEGALCGTFTVSTNFSLLELTGMSRVFDVLVGEKFPTVSQQVKALVSLKDSELECQLRSLVAVTTKQNCGLESRIEELSQSITFQT